MSPEQIEAVRRTWSAALAHGDSLVSAIAADLVGHETMRAAGARWATDSITRLLLVLDRPAAFTAAAADDVAVPPLTVEAVDGVQDAVVAAVRLLVGGLGSADERAWRLAFALLRELVAEHLDLFVPDPTL